MADGSNVETSDFLQELKRQAVENEQKEESSNDQKTFTDPKDGTVYEWDDEKQGWFPKVDDDFLAAYQMNYGFTDDTEKKDAELTAEEKCSSTVEDRQPQPVAKAEKTEVNLHLKHSS